MKRIGIVGGGRFGLALAEELAETGTEVLLVDRNGQVVQGASGKVTWAVQCDATNPDSLSQAGIADCDMVVIAITSNAEAAMLATVNCKELGVKEVVAKATGELNGKILRKLGADLVIYPDRESARRLARNITDHGAFDLLEVSEGLSIAEIDVPEICRDKTLAEADLRKKSGVTVLCVRRANPDDPKQSRSLETPGPNYAMRADDKLIVFGSPHDIDALNGND